MSEIDTRETIPNEKDVARRPNGLIGLLVVLAVLAVPLACIGFALPLDFLVAVFFGWAFFLWRVVPEVTVSWPGVATAMAAFGGFAVGLHQLLKRVPLPDSSDSPPDRWQARSTAAIAGAVVVLFVAGISVVGAIHQVAWLATSGEPFAESNWEAAERSQSRDNLHNIGLAAHNYHDAFGTFPPGGLFTEDGLPLHSWETHLLNYLDARPLRTDIDMTRPWTDPIQGDVFRERMALFENPMMRKRRGDGDPYLNAAGYALSHYAANQHLFRPNSATAISDITDETSNTILAGEVNANFRPWGDPVNWRNPGLGINQSPEGFGSPFTEGGFFLFCDGDVRFINEDIAPDVLNALGTPSGGEPFEDF